MIQILSIGLGGFFGAISRFMVSKYTNGILGAFPVGTFLVNVTGSFLLAYINYSILQGKHISPEIKNFITIGFIGAYTTMSTFSYESIRLFDQGKYTEFFFNILLNIVLCMLAIILGKHLSLIVTK